MVAHRFSGTVFFSSLRTKLILFISLIIIGVCSGLSWYFVSQQEQSMEQALLRSGTILIKSLVHNGRYGLITQDRDSLEQVVEGAFSVDDVVYVVVTDPNGHRLVEKTKGMLNTFNRLTRSTDRVLYPNPAIATAALSAQKESPIISQFTSPAQRLSMPTNRGKAGAMPTEILKAGEYIYDFSLPVHRRIAKPSQFGPLSLEAQETSSLSPPSLPSSHVYGVIQVGLTKSYMLRTLKTMIWNVTVMAIVIMLIGIAITTMLANQIITPLQKLASMAKQIAGGDLSASVIPRTRDEVGQLTTSINQMTLSLSQRQQAISTYMDTITKQVSQLSTLNQTGIAISSTLDVDRLVTTVLKLLVDNLGFVRMLLVFNNPEKQVGVISQVTGVSEAIEALAKDREIPVHSHDGIHADLLLNGKPVLVQDIEAAASRIFPPGLKVCREIGVISFIAAPLKSQSHILGYLAADRGQERCTQEDLDVLMTIANHVSVALDNAQTYHTLEQLNQTLEERVHERTEALQKANAQLLEHDRLKSMFVSIASHELRTPMTSMKGMVKNMLDQLTGPLTERQSFYLTRMNRNLERLTRMSNDLLDLSKIEAGVMRLSCTRFSFRELASEVVDVLQAVAQQTSRQLVLEIAPLLPSIMGDRDKLDQVLTNLINNAIKFSQPGGVIQIEARCIEEQTIEVCVSDSGCGIPHDEIPHIFERFYRGESVAVEARGSGLGLAISKSIIELHGGKIWAQSQVGQGSQLYFTVPLDASSVEIEPARSHVQLLQHGSGD